MSALDVPADAPICASGKRPFRTEKQAQAELQNARWLRARDKQGRRPGVVETAAYECQCCHWWHLSSTDRATRRSNYANVKSGRRRRAS